MKCREGREWGGLTEVSVLVSSEKLEEAAKKRLPTWGSLNYLIATF
jgi:hypothetical protein